MTNTQQARAAYLGAGAVLLGIAVCAFLPLLAPVKLALLAPALLAAETIRRTAEAAWPETDKQRDERTENNGEPTSTQDTVSPVIDVNPIVHDTGCHTDPGSHCH